MRFVNETMSRDWLGWSARFAVVAAICVSLPACGGSFSRALGLEKSSPDEFAIVTKAPLVIPPDFSLRPPRPGAKRPQEMHPSEAAQKALFAGYERKLSQPQTSGEATLLAKAGALEADNSIRAILEAETTMIARKESTLVDQILFWQDDEATGTAVSAGASNNQDAVKETLAGGEVAVDTDRERKGWF